MLQGCFSSCATKQNCHRTLRDPFTQKEIWYQTYWSCFLIPLSLFKTKGRSTSCRHTLSESYFATVSSSKQQHKTTKYQILSSSLFWGHTGLLLQAEWSYMRRCLLNTESCLQRGNKPVGRHCAIQVGGHARQGSQATAHAPSLGAAARISNKAHGNTWLPTSQCASASEDDSLWRNTLTSNHFYSHMKWYLTFAN